MDTGGAKDGVGHGLVHAHGGGQGPTAYIGNTGQVQQALNGTVLTVFSVQNRKNNVYRQALHGYGGGLFTAVVLSCGDDAVKTAVGRKKRGAVSGKGGPFTGSDLIRSGGRQVPGAFLCNADAEHLIALRRQVAENGAGGKQGNLVLGRTASK